MPFIIKKGTAVIVSSSDLADGKEWKTRHENIFYKEDIVIDPLGNIGIQWKNKQTSPFEVISSLQKKIKNFKEYVAEQYAKSGHYGFKKGQHVLIVKTKDVIINQEEGNGYHTIPGA